MEPVRGARERERTMLEPDRGLVMLEKCVNNDLEQCVGEAGVQSITNAFNEDDFVESQEMWLTARPVSMTIGAHGTSLAIMGWSLWATSVLGRALTTIRVFLGWA